MKRSQNLLELGSVSHSGTPRSDFEFPTPAFGPLPTNDIVFCGKVITRRTEPAQARRESENPFVARLRSPSVGESRWRRSGSGGKRYNGMFGTVKFPLQMKLTQLSDIKTRQERREPMPLPKFPAEEDGGGESCWELVRPLRRRGNLLSSLLAKTSFGCIPNF